MTRAELLKRMEREQYEPPPRQFHRADPETQSSLMALIELVRQGLEK